MRNRRKMDMKVISYLKNLGEFRLNRNLRWPGSGLGQHRLITRRDGVSAHDYLDRLKNLASAVLRDIATIGMRDSAGAETHIDKPEEYRPYQNVSGEGTSGSTPSAVPIEVFPDELQTEISGTDLLSPSHADTGLEPTRRADLRVENGESAPTTIGRAWPTNPASGCALPYSSDIDMRKIADEARILLVDAIRSRELDAA
jgi:hypothetical protein